MELNTLRNFLTVAREENFTRAARQLHLSQPALSRQIAALEQELGSQLFVRSSHTIHLTEAGLLLKRRASELTAQEEINWMLLKSVSLLLKHNADGNHTGELAKQASEIDHYIYKKGGAL